jgi:hypothetical protein
MQMIPSDITFDANATPPQWTDNGEQVIEKGTNIRIKIKGLRSEVDKMYAVGTMKEVRLHALPAARVPHANHASRIILAHYHHRLSRGQTVYQGAEREEYGTKYTMSRNNVYLRVGVKVRQVNRGLREMKPPACPKQGYVVA